MKLDQLNQLNTPAAVIDIPTMDRNIAAMQVRMRDLGVTFRLHVKTTKCVEVVRAQIAAGATGITVSTLREAEEFFAGGMLDILYAVGIAPPKLPRAWGRVRDVDRGGHGVDPACAEDDLRTRFPIGAKLRILPNHACATGAQFPVYHALSADGDVAVWRRFHGW